MSRIPVERDPSVWLDYSALQARPLPVRDDRWDEVPEPPFDWREGVQWVVFVGIVLAVLAMSVVGWEPVR